jgi:hypothetical protein
MRERHLRRLAKGERRRREHQERGRAALRRHARKARRLEAAVGPDAVDQRQLGPDLVLRDVEHAALVVETARADLGRVRVDGDGREAFDGGHVSKMLAEAPLVDGEIGIKWQQHRRDHAVRDIVHVPGHGSPPIPPHSGARAKRANPGSRLRHRICIWIPGPALRAVPE